MKIRVGGSQPVLIPPPPPPGAINNTLMDKQMREIEEKRDGQLGGRGEPFGEAKHSRSVRFQDFWG